MDKVAKLQQLHQKMIEEIMDYAIVLLDIDGTILTWNKGVESIKGFKEDEVVGQNIMMFYLAQDRREGLPQQILEHARKEGRAKHIGRRLRKDGSTFWASVVITAIHDDNDEVIGFTKLTRELKEGEIGL
jgi:PAS domain S-box-containing protein